MDGLAGATSVTSLNGVDGLGGLFAGGQAEAALGGRDLLRQEAVVGVARLLRRSEATLTRLDLRCSGGACRPAYLMVCDSAGETFSNAPALRICESPLCRLVSARRPAYPSLRLRLVCE